VARGSLTDREEDGAVTARGGFGLRLPLPGESFAWVVIAFVSTYGLVATLLVMPAEPSLAPFVGAMALLVLLCASVFIGSLLAARHTVQRAFLALSVVPALTITRLVFADATLPVLDPLFVYLLLAAALTTFAASERESWGLRDLNRGAVLRALLLGVGLAAGFVVLGWLFPADASSVPQGSIGIYLLAIVPSAFLDEFWFRGILQSRLAAAGTRNLGWLVTLALFVAYGAPFGNVYTLLFRMGYGAVFGAVAMGRGNLPVTLAGRTLLAIALIVVAPGFGGGSFLV
jgi:hypothetical protein